jgi:hypothetical protein
MLPEQRLDIFRAEIIVANWDYRSDWLIDYFFHPLLQRVSNEHDLGHWSHISKGQIEMFREYAISEIVFHHYFLLEMSKSGTIILESHAQQMRFIKNRTYKVIQN